MSSSENLDQQKKSVDSKKDQSITTITDGYEVKSSVNEHGELDVDFNQIKKDNAKRKYQINKEKDWADHVQEREARIKDSKQLSQSIDLSLITSAICDYKQVRSKLLSECVKKKGGVRGRPKKVVEEKDIKEETQPKKRGKPKKEEK